MIKFIFFPKKLHFRIIFKEKPSQLVAFVLHNTVNIYINLHTQWKTESKIAYIYSLMLMHIQISMSGARFMRLCACAWFSVQASKKVNFLGVGSSLTCRFLHKRAACIQTRFRMLYSYGLCILRSLLCTLDFAAWHAREDGVKARVDWVIYGNKDWSHNWILAYSVFGVLSYSLFVK